VEKFKNRELSWLTFNERVLQEADDKTVPLIERFKFLGIFSSNLDEFFRIRVASLKRIARYKKIPRALGFDAADILEKIYHTVIDQQDRFSKIYRKLLKELAKENIYLVDEKGLTPSQGQFVKGYFQQRVLPALVPIMIDKVTSFPSLRDKSIYLAIRLSHKSPRRKPRYALIEIPETLPRFVVLPDIRLKYIILLEDIIRYCLDDIFYIFSYTRAEGWIIKLTRDAELDIDHDIAGSFIEKISRSLKMRKKGEPVRFSYDQKIPPEFLSYLVSGMKLNRNDLIPGGKYHNFKDFINFPNIGGNHMVYPEQPPLPHRDLRHKSSIIDVISRKDCILHLPYQSFDYVIQFLREAAIDPKVRSIKITLYRVAQNSNIVKALINAARNGKSVTACLELQARFDEKANIYWSTKMEEEGVKVIHGIPGFKIHSKICLVGREEKRKMVYYANIGTGNFHEGTAKVYCDHSFFTSDPAITAEVRSVFEYIEFRKKPQLSQLLVSPFNFRSQLLRMIRNEIQECSRGNEAAIIIKVNHIVDEEIISALYEASQAGVKVDIIARSTCSLVAGVKGLSRNISAVSIVDRYLEHARVFVFCNGGKPSYYLTSSDLMKRNLDYRIEVGFPVHNKEIQQEIAYILDVQLRDNTKARVLDGIHDNKYKRMKGSTQIRTHTDVYNFLKQRIK
jgi:polyphosphate kinase